MGTRERNVTYDEFFTQATGFSKPYHYQRRLALAEELPEVLSIPTGIGKTAAVILAWLFRRFFHPDAKVRNATPRRLVYCLPMRTLVEQTYVLAVRWIGALGMLAAERAWTERDEQSVLTQYLPHPEKDQFSEGAWAKNQGVEGKPIAVHLLLGGQRATDWAIWPDREAVLVGTQDMLLSRALNRGYAARRARWPIEFGLLHSDCLWVFDEVQLMGSALATTAQLDAFAKKLWRPVKSKRFLWMSATVESSILETQDRKDWGVPSAEPWELEEEDRVQLRTRLQAPKTLQLVNKRPTAEKILKTHPRGRLSLVMLNTVPVAKKVYGEIGQEIARTAAKTNSKVCRPTVCLLHSRFRPMERDSRMESLLAFLKEMDESGAVPDSDGLIVVSTQVVEAGVDMSAARLWSEVAPWPSMIQRLGRLNREGAQPDACASFWMPMADDTNKGDESPNAKRVGPYEKGALNCARTLLEEVIGRQADSSSYRDALDAVLLTEESREAMQVKPELVIRPDDFFELFSTEPDLAGGFTNVAQFVRDQDRNVDVRVFWREFDPAKIAQPNESAPLREELCSVPFFEFRQFVGKGHAVWEWNFEMGKWESRRASEIQPGMTLLLPKSAGGYQPDVGWTGDSKHRDFCVLPGSDDDDSLDTDFLSGAQEWISLSGHLADVEHEMHEILEGVGLEETPFAKALMAAAHRHDWGKSLDNWQDAVKVYAKNAYAKLEEFVQSAAPPGFDAVASEWQDRLRSESAIGQPWAKFPDIRAASLDSRLKLSDPERAILAHDLKVQFRPMLRHEAASALAAWQSWLAGSDELTALAVYLVACHHGKVRAVLRSTHASDDVFGLTDDMVLQPIPGCSPTRVTLRMDAKYVGASGEWDEKGDSFMITSPSWLQMVAELLGPKRESDPVMAEVVPGNEPHDLGPLTLAYLESLLRAADARASRLPGKGAKL